jgi:hypothetical protein
MSASRLKRFEFVRHESLIDFHRHSNILTFLYPTLTAQFPDADVSFGIMDLNVSKMRHGNCNPSIFKRFL